MTSQEARATVLGATAVVLAVTTADKAADGDWPGVRTVVGASFMAVGLSALAAPAPDLAAGLASLVAVTSIIVQGDIFDRIASAFTRR